MDYESRLQSRGLCIEKLAEDLVIGNYGLEKMMCDYLGLRIGNGDWVMAYYKFESQDKPWGWQVVCHISKLDLYLSGLIGNGQHEVVKKAKAEDEKL